MSSITEYLGGSGGVVYPFSLKAAEITTNSTYVAPYAGDYIIVCCGGGGGSSDESYYDGGSGSGFLIKKVTLSKGESVDVTIGTGGAAGSSGGTTSFGTYLSAIGGNVGTDSGSIGVNGGGNGAAGNGNGAGNGGIYVVPQIISNLLVISTSSFLLDGTSDTLIFQGEPADGDSGGGGAGPRPYGVGGTANGAGTDGICIVLEQVK